MVVDDKDRQADRHRHGFLALPWHGPAPWRAPCGQLDHDVCSRLLGEHDEGSPLPGDRSGRQVEPEPGSGPGGVRGAPAARAGQSLPAGREPGPVVVDPDPDAGPVARDADAYGGAGSVQSGVHEEVRHRLHQRIRRPGCCDGGLRLKLDVAPDFAFRQHQVGEDVGRHERRVRSRRRRGQRGRGHHPLEPAHLRRHQPGQRRPLVRRGALVPAGQDGRRPLDTDQCRPHLVGELRPVGNERVRVLLRRHHAETEASVVASPAEEAGP